MNLELRNNLPKPEINKNFIWPNYQTGIYTTPFMLFGETLYNNYVVCYKTTVRKKSNEGFYYLVGACHYQCFKSVEELNKCKEIVLKHFFNEVESVLRHFQFSSIVDNQYPPQAICLIDK